MFQSLFSLSRGLFALLLVIANTLFWSVPLYLLTLLRLLLPVRSARQALARAITRVAESWIGVNNALFVLAPNTRLEVSGLDGLRLDRWYLICSNHASSVDIPILQKVFYRRIPFIRFFIKQELIWVPVLGLAWWALDYPFVKRYSQAYLARHPEKRGADLESTRRACLKFEHFPTTILNFVEGTRITPRKHRAQDSPYRHLLKPKTGGAARVMASMGRLLDGVLDVTLYYPDGHVTLWDLLTGRITRVVVHVRQRPLPDGLSGDLDLNDDTVRAAFQEWMTALWEEKDALLESWRSGASAAV